VEEESQRQAVLVHEGAERHAWATRVVDTVLEAALACCISSTRSMLCALTKVGNGSFMEMTVAAEANRGQSPRRVLSTSTQLETGESL
jgi:hypothetical protein